MKFEFNIPTLIAMAADVTYQPQLSVAINKMLASKNQIEYKLALKDATDAVTGTVSLDKLPDYGRNNNAHIAGMPLFQPVRLTIPDQKGMTLDGAVVSFNRQKNIVQTVVQGRDSSVKEFINNSDYHISISGIMCQAGWEYPLDQVKNFIEFMNYKGPLEINHEVLNAIGVQTIVVMDHDCPKTPMFNCQTFSFSAISDEALPLIQTHKI